MSVFSDDWRVCLREHYKHVIRESDKVTEPTLADVLNMVGFTDDELRQLRVEATMRTEDVPDDFQPDLEILAPAKAEETPATPQVAHPAECQCPSCVNIDLTPHDEDGQPVALEDDQEDNPPEQLSMF